MSDVISTKKNVHQIQTGDVLAWGYVHTKGLGRFVRKFVQMMTLSSYAHVGIAVVKDDVLYVLEAVEPTISINMINPNDNFYVVPMNLTDTTNLDAIAVDYVGMPYSLMDCIRGYLGLQIDGNHRWQCAELVTEVLRRLGHDINPRRLTPQEVVYAALAYTTSANGLWIY